jgi:proteic killer suppression protein
MIKSWMHKGLKKFFETGSVAGIQAKHATKLSNILGLLNDAEEVKDMNVPGYGLHPLKGNMKGLWAVKVSGNWRIVFRFENGDAYVVDYLDYH